MVLHAKIIVGRYGTRSDDNPGDGIKAALRSGGGAIDGADVGHCLHIGAWRLQLMDRVSSWRHARK